MIFIKRYGIIVNKQFKVNKKRHFSTILGIIMSMILFTMVGYIKSYTGDVNLLSLKHETGNYEGVFLDLSISEIKDVKNNFLVNNVGVFKAKDIDSIISNIVDRTDYGKIDLIQGDKIFINNIFTQVINLESGRLPQNPSEVIIDSYGKYIYEKSVGEYIEIDDKNYEIVGIFKGNDKFTTKAIDAITLLENYDVNCNIALSTIDTLTGKEKYKAIKDIGRELYINETNEDKIFYNKRVFNKLGVDIDGYREYSGGSFVEIGLYLGILLVSVFLIYGSINVSIKERVKEFAILRCIGATPSKIKLLLIKESIYLAVLSIIPGAIISQGICYIITNIFFKNYLTVSDIALGYSFYKKDFILVILLTIISICISSIIPILNMSKVSPLEGIRSGGVIQKGLKNRNAKLIRRIFGYNGELAYKNIRANNRNFIITTVTSSILLIIFIVFSVYNVNMINSYNTEDELNKDFTISIDIDSREDYFDILEKSKNHINEVKELEITEDIFSRLEFHTFGLIRDVELNKYVNKSKDTYVEKPIQIENVDYLYSNKVSFLIMDDNYLVDLINREFGNNSKVTIEDLDENGVFICKRTVVKNYFDIDKVPLYNLKQNENFNMYIGENNESGVNTSYNEYDRIVKGSNLINLEYLGSVDARNIINIPRYDSGDSTIIIASERFYEKNRELLNRKNIDSSIELTLDYKDNLDREVSRDKAKNYSSKIGGYYLEIAESNKRVRAEINIMSVLIYTVLILTMFIGGINIINNKYINIRLRGKEIGTLLALGINKKRLTKILMLEGLMQWLITTIIGISISSIILRLLLEYLYYANTVVSYSTIIASSIIGALIILVINILGVYLPIRKLQYTKTTELIRSSE